MRAKPDRDRPEWYFIKCPACQHNHVYAVNPGMDPGDLRWGFNGNLEMPTFTHSLRLTWQNDGHQRMCHFNVTDGKIIFHTDCTHELAGQTLDLVEFD